MKKALLLLLFLFTNSIIFSQSLNQPSQFNNVCDDNNDGFALFLMQEIGTEITGNNQNLVVTHHLTQADAANNVNPLPFTYTNVVNPQLIFARVRNTVTNQVQITTYLLNVNPIPIANNMTITVCDYNNDGFASIDLNGTITSFQQGNIGAIVTFFETLTNANLGVNPLQSPIQNTTPQIQTIYVRIENPTSGCFVVTTLTVLIVNCTGQSGQPQDLNACSYGTSACFNLTQNNSNILGTLNPSEYQLTYYTTQSDANTGVNPILTTTNFCTSTSTTVIYARLLKLQDNTYQVLSFNLIVSIPPPIPSQTITACSTNFQCWNLTSIIPNVTNGQNCEVYFFPTQLDALNWTNQIPNPTCFASVIAAPIQPPLYFRVECVNQQNCVSIGTLNLTTISCYVGGQPQGLTACSDTGGFACVDLNLNNANVLGNLNPTQNTVTYHINQSDASTGSNPMSSPFCPPYGTYTIYTRVASNDGLNSFLSTFVVTSANYENSTTQLNTIIQCDDNNNGLIIWDLTVVQAQINTTNSLSYYTTLLNAQNMTSPIGNPAAWTTNVQSNLFPIYIREVVIGDCDIIHIVSIQGLANCNAASACSSANSLCSSLGVPFSNTTGVTSSGSANCLGTTPNPTWFYFPISSAGTINLQISQVANTGGNSDVDYILYGPFTNQLTPCSNLSILLNNVVSCSYSTASIENAVIQNAQPGQIYILMVTNFSNQAGQISIIQSNIGQTNSGAIDCSGLRLKAFLDTNNNGSQDNGESNFPLGQFHYEKNDNGIVHNITAPSGTYAIYDSNATNSYDVSFSVDAAYTTMYTVAPSAYSNLSVVIGSGLITYNFPVTVVQSYNDLAVTIVPLNAPRPGFTYQNKIVYTNLGNQNVTSGTLTFIKNASVTITANSQSGTTPNANGFTYNFTNLAPFEMRTITVTMQIPTIPTVNAGQILTNSASIVPLDGDLVPENNSNAVSQIVINAYDPNDKMESHGERILHATFTSNDYLYYTIRFENTGTASAINVRINDILDSQLDETTVRMVDASHSYQLDRVGNNLTWRFDNIQLPVSVANTTIGKGYVIFKVKPRPGYAVGDIIPNTAAIYFDFNPAIITNTFLTQFVATLGVNQFENQDFVFYPNPTSDVVTVSLTNTENSITSIKVYDILGKTILTTKVENVSSQIIDLSDVNSGMYFIEVTTDSNLKVVKKLMVK